MPALKTAIAFGLVHIPVELTPAADEQDIGFNMLHKTLHKRIRYSKTAEGAEGEVPASDIVKAYRYDKDSYVIMEDADFEKIKTRRDKTIEVRQFSDSGEIDGVYYKKSYYVTSKGAEKAFNLFIEALKTTGKTAIATAVLGTKESLVALRVSGGALLASTLFFSGEIRSAPVIQPPKAPLAEAELKMAVQLVEALSSPFIPENYENEYNKRLMAAINAKIAGQEITAAEREETSAVDLMDALEKSLAAAGKSMAPPPPPQDSGKKAARPQA